MYYLYILFILKIYGRINKKGEKKELFSLYSTVIRYSLDQRK